MCSRISGFFHLQASLAHPPEVATQLLGTWRLNENTKHDCTWKITKEKNIGVFSVAIDYKALRLYLLFITFYLRPTIILKCLLLKLLNIRKLYFVLRDLRISKTYFHGIYKIRRLKMFMVYVYDFNVRHVICEIINVDEKNVLLKGNLANFRPIGDISLGIL